VIGPAALALAAVGVVAQPPGTRCPAREQLAEAIATHVPDEIVGWAVRYSVESSAEPPIENRLQLVLTDGEGRVRLRRELTIADDGCAAAAEGVALILERFFAQVSWTAAVPLPELERAPEPPPPGRRWELQLGASGRREVALAPGLALDARAAVAPAWLASGGLVLEPARVSQPVGLASVALFSLPVRLSLRRSFGARAVTFEAGPAATFIGERGSPTPGLPGGAAYRLLGAAGAVAAARWSPWPQWAVVLEAGADVTLFGAPFVVEGLGEVLAPHRIQALGMLGIARVVSR
jgi:hypothetical protein